MFPEITDRLASISSHFCMRCKKDLGYDLSVRRIWATTYPQQVPNLLTTRGTWSEQSLRVSPRIINHHSRNSISISLNVKCRDLPPQELMPLAMNRTDSRPVREPLSTTAAFRPLIIRRQCLSFLPVPRVTASLTSLEKMPYSQHELRVWVLVLVTAQRRVRSWRAARAMPLSPGVSPAPVPESPCVQASCFPASPYICGSL